MSAKNSGLGKGLDSLIPSDFDTALIMEVGDRVQNLFIGDITPNPDQPRRHFDVVALSELAASIKRFGVLQPIIVSPGPSNKFIIVAGERRYRAAKAAGLEQIPGIVRDREELEQLEVALIENVQRVDLSPLEQAISIERLHQQFNIAYNDIAKRLGKAETTISNIVRLLHLPPVARDALQAGLISEGHARAVLALKDNPDKQSELLELIQANKWSVRQAEQYVASLKSGIKTSSGIKQKLAVENSDTRALAKKLSTKVSLKRTAKGGRLEIYFKDDQELSALITKLKKT